MRPKERRDSGQADLLRSRQDAIMDMDHALGKRAPHSGVRQIASRWRFLLALRLRYAKQNDVYLLAGWKGANSYREYDCDPASCSRSVVRRLPQGDAFNP